MIVLDSRHPRTGWHTNERVVTLSFMKIRKIDGPPQMAILTPRVCVPLKGFVVR